MEEVCKFILSNIYNKKSLIKFIKMDIDDLLFIENKNEKISQYISYKLIKHLNPFSFENVKNKKTFKIVEYNNREIDIMIYNNYWIITLFPIDD
jgi:hypothetical protein